MRISIEPLRLTLYGKRQQMTPQEAAASFEPLHLFQVIDLPVEVVSSPLSVRLNNGLLELILPKAVRMQVRAQAA
ncbi:MAG TPA: Hsp20/alpha crystallin family protein [Terriglobia bacterium]|nr:Hsp20/alpha crystallin family protein [Terriglobia bacterium]